MVHEEPEEDIDILTELSGNESQKADGGKATDKSCERKNIDPNSKKDNNGPYSAEQTSKEENAAAESTRKNTGRNSCVAKEYKICLGSSETARLTSEKFHWLKKVKKFNSNVELLAWLLRVGQIAVDELGKLDVCHNQNSDQNRYGVPPISLNTQMAVNVNSALCSTSTMINPSTNILLVPVKPMALNSTISTASDPIEKTPMINDERSDVNSNTDCTKYRLNSRLAEMTEDYVMSVDEQVYERYAKYLKLKEVEEHNKTDANRKRKQRPGSTTDDNDDADFQRAEQKNLMNEFTLKEGVLSAVKRGRIEQRHILPKGTEQTQAQLQEVSLENPTKKSVYIVNKDEGSQNVLYAAHSKLARESLNLPPPVEVAPCKETGQENFSMVKIVKNKPCNNS